MECRVELISSRAAPTARRHEVGDETVHQILAWAARERADSGVALSVKSNDEHAIGLYPRHGFVDGGVSPDDPGERLMCR
jgi:ribosomal protein S18 acetylase RimI-like enzyme